MDNFSVLINQIDIITVIIAILLKVLLMLILLMIMLIVIMLNYRNVLFLNKSMIRIINTEK